MAKFEVKGLEEYIKQLENLGKNAHGMTKYALYEGADVLANEIRKSMDAAISSQPEGLQRWYSSLDDSLYVQRMGDENGMVYTEVGWAGYDDEGRPNPMKAAILESGQSDQHRAKTGFIRKAVRAAKDKSTAAMKAAFEEKIQENMKE